MKSLAILTMLCATTAAQADEINSSQANSKEAYGQYFDHVASQTDLGSRQIQAAGWLYGFVGRSDLIPTLGENYIAPSLQQCDVPQGATKVANALQAVLDASGSHSVLLLNESHTHKQARLFLYNNLDCGPRAIATSVLRPLEKHLSAVSLTLTPGMRPKVTI